MKFKVVMFFLLMTTLVTPCFSMSWGEGENSRVNGIEYKTYLIEANSWYIITFFDLKTDEPKLSHVTKPSGRSYWLIWKEIK